MEEKKKRSEQFMQLIEKVDQLPVALVIGTQIPIYTKNHIQVREQDLPYLQETNYLALCPFHADEKLGSFVITPSKNMWWCFTERIGWRGIHFEMKYFELEFKDAVLHLARRFSLISDEEYTRYSRKKIDENLVKKIEESMEKRVDILPDNRADIDVIRFVYGLIPRVCGLKDQDREHLIKVRGLTEEDLGDYFSFPTRKFDLVGKVLQAAREVIAENLFKKPLKSLNEKELEKLRNHKGLKRVEEQIGRVPGFYKDDKTGSIDFASYKGIGFVVRDDRGFPTGIQIRRSVIREGESRYVWFSSAFARAKDGCSMGASSGSPGGVIMPKDPSMASLCITEGRFKAEQIAKKGNIAVYVSGVSTWKSVLPMIERLKKDKKKIYLMFDSDLMGNTAVHAQLAEVAENIRMQRVKPCVILWPIARGKGFDDLVANTGDRYSDYLKSMSFEKFEKIYRKALEDTLQSLGVKRIRDISREDRSKFNTAMQLSVEKAAGLKKEDL